MLIQLSGCFEILAKFNAKNFENFKYTRMQFYRKLSLQKYDASKEIIVQNNNNYQRVITPQSAYRSSKFQQKGIILTCRQKKIKYFRHKELCFLAWAVTHLIYWLYDLQIIPFGSLLSIEPPPWTFQQPLKKPEARNYIIEPDWSSAPTKSICI
ncbi:uncharacterized protein LOC114338188 [Diabrotica virgifera virgifera]|uniref:Uncharacterized protein LOC114338188 n=1 Tax=Diabrotica virgifera virgifera TaxID=50390 RepID=A0A6P7GDL9_DIAVI|nr:uncharacterized protein LOC114338188 [Diabrotica virgifera virgifera]